MMRLPRYLTTAALAISFSIPFAGTVQLLAQDTPSVEAPTPAHAPDNPLRKAVDDFWHYAKIGRYDLASPEATKALAAGDDVKILEAFEFVAQDHNDNLDQWMIRWQAVPALKDQVTTLINTFTRGYRTRRANPAFIKQQIERLALSDRGYILGMERLRESGELAVPIMVDFFRNQDKKHLQGLIRRALLEIGRPALNPLVTATEMRDQETLVIIVSILGELRYPVAVPYLSRVANNPASTPAVKAAANDAMIRIGVLDPTILKPADLSYELAEKFYYESASITADFREPVALLWSWDETKGLSKREIAPVIFNETMALRSVEVCLRLDPANEAAVSLWLAANNKLEIELPPGAFNPVRPQGRPDAHYYNVASGVRHLNMALARAIKDRNAPLALKLTKSLQGIVGQSNMFPEGMDPQPIIQALKFPDRQVRFEAAFAIAAALPQEPFDGQDLVVPLLCDAISQTGRTNVLCVAPTAVEASNMVKLMRNAGYGAVPATTAENAVIAAQTMPSCDVILAVEELTVSQIDKLFVLAVDTPRLERAARVIITKYKASPWSARAIDDPLLNTTQATDVAGLRPVIEQARIRSGALPLDAALASSYATRSADLINLLVISRGQIFDLSGAQQTLLMTLDDPRPDIVKAAGRVLAIMDSTEAQVGLYLKAADEKTSNDIRVALFRCVATSAKFFGNRLQPEHVAALVKTAASASSLDVRSAAAEAAGALNITAEQAKILILQGK